MAGPPGAGKTTVVTELLGSSVFDEEGRAYSEGIARSLSDDKDAIAKYQLFRVANADSAARLEYESK